MCDKQNECQTKTGKVLVLCSPTRLEIARAEQFLHKLEHRPCHRILLASEQRLNCGQLEEIGLFDLQ